MQERHDDFDGRDFDWWDERRQLIQRRRDFTTSNRWRGVFDTKSGHLYVLWSPVQTEQFVDGDDESTSKTDFVFDLKLGFDDAVVDDHFELQFPNESSTRHWLLTNSAS
jgi:hypothetical protein